MSSAKEKFAEFLSYLKLLFFIGVIGAAGFFVYRHQKSGSVVPAAQKEAESVTTAQPTPVVPKPTRPSALLNAVIELELTDQLADLNQEPKELSANFLDLEKKINVEKINLGPQQSSWNAAGTVCLEIHRIAKKRVEASASLKRQTTSTKLTDSTNTLKVDLDEVEKRKKFFADVATKKWAKSAAEQRQRVALLMKQLDDTEKFSKVEWAEK